MRAMNILQIFERLSYGELSNLSLANDGNGSIRDEDHARIIMYINEGLLKLYTRFVLSEKDLLLETVSHITNYHLLSKYAESKWDPEEVPYPYIKDLGREPFTEDVIKILSVHNTYGIRLPLNDGENPYSLFTPQKNVLQVPHPTDGGALSVQYQAKHPILDASNLDAEIELQDELIGALTAHVGYKVYLNMNTAETAEKAKDHLAIYEATCLEAEDRDVTNTSNVTSNTKFRMRGWV